MKYTGTRQRKIESAMNVNDIAGFEEHVGAAEEPAGAEAIDLADACHSDTQRVHSPHVIGFDQRPGEGEIVAPEDDVIADVAAHLDNHLRLAHSLLHGGGIGVGRRRWMRFDLFGFTTSSRQRHYHQDQQPYAHFLLYIAEHLRAANVPSAMASTSVENRTKISLFISLSCCLMDSVLAENRAFQDATERFKDGREMGMVHSEEKHLAVVVADAGEGVSRLREQLRAGANFILIGSESADVAEGTFSVLRLSADRMPKRLTRHGLFLLGPHLKPRDFDLALQALQGGEPVYFVEHLDLALTKPPKVRRYLVYCDVWGIISQHDDLHDAENAWTDYVTSLNAQRPCPEAGIYKWEGDLRRSLETETHLLRQI